jgi:predicted  nucleic acid-binding Zn-ribbon protein
MELAIFTAYRDAGIAEDKAQALTRAVTQVIDERYAIHSRNLSTQGDIEKLRLEIERVRVELEKSNANTGQKLVDLHKQMNELSWRLIGAVIAANAFIAAMLKHLF